MTDSKHADTDEPRTPDETDGKGTPDEGSQQPGAEGGEESPSKHRLPFWPAKDGTPLGDTDQHSDA